MEIDYHEDALKVIRENIDSWSLGSKENTVLTLLTGTSNKVFKIETVLNISPVRLIYRFFGPNEITDKIRERKIFNKLDAEGLGPTNYGESATSRIEKYLEGFVPMTASQFTDTKIIPKICSVLKKLHGLNMSDVLNEDFSILDSNLIKWKNIASEKINVFERKDEVLEILSENSWNLYEEVLPKASPLVFSHLDPSHVNILYNPESEKIAFIDYEFSGYAYRSIDLGMLLSEIRLNYLYPFPPFYEFCPEKAPNDELIKRYVIEYGGGKDLWIETKQALIVANYIWAVWHLAMYNPGTSGFDYLGNAIMRFDEFINDCRKFKENGGVEYLRLKAEEIF